MMQVGHRIPQPYCTAWILPVRALLCDWCVLWSSAVNVGKALVCTQNFSCVCRICNATQSTVVMICQALYRGAEVLPTSKFLYGEWFIYCYCSLFGCDLFRPCTSKRACFLVEFMALKIGLCCCGILLLILV